jgi:hypothetical protein
MLGELRSVHTTSDKSWFKQGGGVLDDDTVICQIILLALVLRFFLFLLLWLLIPLTLPFLALFELVQVGELLQFLLQSSNCLFDLGFGLSALTPAFRFRSLTTAASSFTLLCGIMFVEASTGSGTTRRRLPLLAVLFFHFLQALPALCRRALILLVMAIGTVGTVTLSKFGMQLARFPFFIFLRISRASGILCWFPHRGSPSSSRGVRSLC